MGVLILCIRYLRRHPIELAHLPATVIADLMALAEVEAEAVESHDGS